MDREQAREIVLDALGGLGVALDLDSLDGASDLLQAGLVDSARFLELVAEIERRGGMELDFSDADPEDFVCIDGLAHLLVMAHEERDGSASIPALAPLMEAFDSGEGSSLVSGESCSEEQAMQALKWILEASRPYVDVLFGSVDVAADAVRDRLLVPRSEYSIHKATLLLADGVVSGGFIALPGPELARCRHLDLLEFDRRLEGDGATQYRAALERLKDLFAPVGDDAYYLSKIGVAATARGQGLGRQLLGHYFERARALGLRIARLDVSADNQAAIALYRASGFREIARGSSPPDGLEYLSFDKEVGR